MICKKCGENIEDGAAFCETCGAKVLENTNVTAASLSATTVNGVNQVNNNVNNVANVNNVNGMQVGTNAVNNQAMSNGNMQMSAPQQGQAQDNALGSVENQGAVINSINQGSTSEQMAVNQNEQTQVNMSVQGNGSVTPMPQMVDLNMQQTNVNSSTEFNQDIGNATMQGNGMTQINSLPQQVNNAQVTPQVNNTPRENQNRKSFFIAVGVMGVIMVLLITLIASGGIKFNFTVSKGGEKQSSQNQTIPQNNDNDENESRKDTPTTSTTVRTTTRTTVAPVTNEGKYVDYSDISLYVPYSFEYSFNDTNLIHSLISDSKKQAISMTMSYQSYDIGLTGMPSFKQELVKNGATLFSDGSSNYKGLRYYYIKLKLSGINVESILMEVPNIGCFLSQTYVDYATEADYLETLYEIATKSKKASNASSFAPGGDKSAIADEFKTSDVVNPSFE